MLFDQINIAFTDSIKQINRIQNGLKEDQVNNYKPEIEFMNASSKVSSPDLGTILFSLALFE